MGYTGQRPSAIPLTTADIVDGTISNADLAGSITSAKITSLDATKLTGTVADARITTLTASKLSGVVPTANLGTGTASSTTVLYGDGTYKTEPVTDTTSIKNDISLLALQTAINGNLSSYGLKNSWIEQFENSTYIANLSTVSRDTSSEYVSSVYGSGVVTPANTKVLLHMDSTDGATSWTDSSASPHTITNVNSAVHTTTAGNYHFGGSAGNFTGSWRIHTADTADTAFGTGEFYVGMWMKVNVLSNAQTPIFGNRNSGANDNTWWYLYSNSSGQIRLDTAAVNIAATSAGALTQGTWTHVAMSRNSSNLIQLFVNGVVQGSATSTNNFSASGSLNLGHDFPWGSYYNGWYDEFIMIKGSGGHVIAFTPETEAYGTGSVANATGSFTSTVVVPQDAVNKSSVGLVILYKDQAGTTTFNGANQLVAKVRANTGQAYQEVVLAGAGTYSDGLKIAVAPAIAVTAGQALSYEISFAGQSASLETRVHGVAMTY